MLQTHSGETKVETQFLIDTFYAYCIQCILRQVKFTEYSHLNACLLLAKPQKKNNSG